MWKLWVISAGLFLILESITTGFLVFWFAIGSIFAMIVSSARIEKGVILMMISPEYYTCELLKYNSIQELEYYKEVIKKTEEGFNEHFNR